MKVIVVGMPKTGVTSMKSALTMLGYNVYGTFQNFYHLNKEWQAIYLTGGKMEDFYNMFKNVDAVVDIPAVYFWDEIHKAFPSAKVVWLVF